MSDEQTNFKVTDRRLFNPDGTPRDLSPEEKAEPRLASSAEPSVSAGRPETGSEPRRIVEPGSANRETATAETPEENDFPDADDPASFINFIVSIASNAASSLGMIEHPVSHQREVDLELGKHWIDTLGMLQQKTLGNLSAQEKKVLEGLLADLRMQYVSLANSAPPKASRTYSGRDITGGK